MVLENDINGSFVRFNRFNVFNSIYSFEMFSNPIAKFNYQGFDLNVLPYNLHSADYLPSTIDFDKIEFNLRNGKINVLSKSIPDSLIIAIRGFLGSITGDPLIYRFTKSNLESSNKNKIVPSGEFTISNKIDRLKYRFSLGYYGHFSTNLRYAKTISKLSSYYLNKQNKQVLLKGEIYYDFDDGKSIYISNNFISNYSWELLPFSMNLNHVEFYLNLTRLKISNLIDGLTLSFKRDGSENYLNRTSVTIGSSDSFTEIGVGIDYEYTLENLLDLNLHSELNNLSFSNTSNSLNEQKLLPEMENSYYDINGEIKYYINKMSFVNVSIGLQNSFQNKNSISASMLVKGNIADNLDVSLEASKYNKSPSMFELFGKYKASSLVEDFRVSGKENLIESEIRDLRVALDYSIKNFESRTIIGQTLMLNPIINNINSQSVFDNNIYIRSSELTNGASVKLNELREEINIEIANLIFLRNKMKYAWNEQALFVPKFRAKLNIIFQLSQNSLLGFNYSYIDKTLWKEFENFNDLEKVFVNPELKKISIWDVNFQQSLTELFFLNEVVLNITIYNLFNTNEQYHPLGNNFARTLIFSFKGKL